MWSNVEDSIIFALWGRLFLPNSQGGPSPIHLISRLLFPLKTPWWICICGRATSPIKAPQPITNDSWDVPLPLRWVREQAAEASPNTRSHVVTYFWPCLSPHRRQTRSRWTARWLPPSIWGIVESNKSLAWSFMFYPNTVFLTHRRGAFQSNRGEIMAQIGSVCIQLCQ